MYCYRWWDRFVSIVNTVTKNKVMIFEINEKIIKNLKLNLSFNNIRFKGFKLQFAFK